MITRRRFLAAASASALLAVPLTACADDEGTGGSATTTVRFGYNADYNGASLLALAEAEDLWAEHGLKADTSKFTDGPLQIQAMGAGDLDYGYIGPGALWLPAGGKAKIVAINTLGFADRLIAQPGSGIETVADLKGRKVGVPEGTSGDMILQLALEKAGMAADDVEKVPMDPATIVSAFSSGQIDAAGIWYPNVATIEEQRPDVVTLAKNEDFFPETTFPTAFVAANGVVEKDEKTARKVIAVLQEANDLRASDREAAVKATAGFLEVPEQQLAAEAENVRALETRELVAATDDGRIGDWLTGLQDLFVTFGKLPEPADPETFYTGDLYTSTAGG